MDSLYLDMININKLIYPMSDKEFWEFINTDKYGNRGTDKIGLLNLLHMIMSKRGFESKETLIYKLLSYEVSKNQ